MPIRDKYERIFRRKTLHLILIYFGVWSIDLLINFINNGRKAAIPEIALDQSIPFIPEFIYFYSIYFPLVVSPLLILLHAHEHLRRYVAANVFVMIVSYATFVIFPTKLIRVTLQPFSFAEKFTLLYHHLVAPYNLLPSMHVSMLLLASFSLFAYQRRVGLLFAVPIGSSIASVVLTKQHYVLDLFTAIPLAIFAWIFCRGLSCKTLIS